MPEAPRAYMICTSPRSGSTLLCGLLRATGVAGRPGSLLHKTSLDGWLGYYGLKRADFVSELAATRAVLQAALNKGRGGTDLFGLRMQRPSFAFFTDQLERIHPEAATDRARIEAAFGPTSFIHLTRKDKLAQAVSREMATQIGLWHRNADGSELERLRPPQEPHYDRAAIAEHLARLEEMESGWHDWFARQGLRPLTLTYEGLSEDPHGTLAVLLDHLDLSRSSMDNVTIPTAKLADATSADWIARFQSETA